MIYLLGLMAFTGLLFAEADIQIKLTAADCQTPGRVLQQGEIASPSDMAKDAYCADYLLKTNAPMGVVTVFGSARLKEGSPAYEKVREFAKMWAEKNKQIPLLTGGGPGLMEAGNRGAKEGKGKSLGFLTPFATGVEKPNPFCTASYSFADFAMRESMMVNPAKAIVIGSGGVGTAWELFESISKKQTKKIRDIPIIFMGTKDEWNELQGALSVMTKQGLVNDTDQTIVKYASTPEEAVKLIEDSLNRNDRRSNAKTTH